MLDFTFERQLELERRDCTEDGIAKGERKNLLSLICRKLRKEKSLEQIAEELEEDVSVIEPFYQFAKTFAPDYDEEQVFEAYEKRT